MMIAIFSGLAVVIIGFFARQIYIFYAGPEIELLSPVDGAEVEEKVMISGSASSDATVIVNENFLAVDAEGNFKVEIEFDEGNHTLVVVVVDRNGREKTVRRSFSVVGR